MTIQLKTCPLLEELFPLTETVRAEITREYLLLSPTMRSVAGQVAIQTHLYDYEFPTVANFVQSMNYDLSDTTQQKYPNFWYKLHAGRALTQSNTLSEFFNGVDYFTADLLRHPIWYLIDSKITLEESLRRLVSCHGSKILKSGTHLWPLTKDQPLTNVKQSYSEQRIKLYKSRTLEALNILLFSALAQIRVCHHKRPTTAEKVAYALFLFLFGFKFDIFKRQAVGEKINQLLTSSVLAKDREVFAQQLDHHFNTIEKIKEQGLHDNAEDLHEFVSDEICKMIMAEPTHRCFS